MLPLHSVKAAGKTTPIISGTVTQAVIQSRKKRRLNERGPRYRSENEAVRPPLHTKATNQSTEPSEWCDPRLVLRSREEFLANLNSKDDN